MKEVFEQLIELVPPDEGYSFTLKTGMGYFIDGSRGNLEWYIIIYQRGIQVYAFGGPGYNSENLIRAVAHFFKKEEPSFHSIH